MSTQLVRGLQNLTPSQKGCVVAIGNFDGVHKGHQTLLNLLKEKSANLNVPSMVMTFEPQPQEFFYGKNSLPRLTGWREKYSLLKEAAIDHLLFMRFNVAIAALSAKEFVEEILYRQLHVKHVIVGEDFQFGYQRKGNVEFLKTLAVEYGFGVDALSNVEIGGSRASSTRVRQALQEGDLETARCLLGRRFTLQGKVVRGDQRGRQLGFPTANIHLKKIPALARGIYAVRLHGVDKKPLAGAASLGIRPTIGGTKLFLEVHVLDFHRDIYGRHVSVEFFKKLRDEKRFENLDVLKQHIAEDVLETKTYFLNKEKNDD